MLQLIGKRNMRSVTIPSGYYRVSGRTVHMDYLKKQLEDKRVRFDASRTAALPDVLVEVHADTVYIQVCTTATSSITL